MNKDQFLLLSKNFTSSSQEDVKSLISLQRQYPYSQVIRSIATRGLQDNELDPNDAYLHVCAVYATDRNVLKEIMTATASHRVEAASYTSIQSPTLPIEKKEQPVTVIRKENPIIKEELPIVKEELPATVSLDTVLHGDDLVNELMNDLKQLKKVKHTFEVSLEKYEKHSELKPIPITDGLIEEIKTTRKKIKTEGPKQKEQTEIIDQFIKTQPNIKAKAKPTVEAVDLSEKSLSHTDKFVSETLVEILIKQDKKEKAVEVLKKLIWKFPQKKAYFAARIEDLSK